MSKYHCIKGMWKHSSTRSYPQPCWRQMVSFTPRPKCLSRMSRCFYCREENVGPRTVLDSVEMEKQLIFDENSTPVPRSPSLYFTALTACPVALFQTCLLNIYLFILFFSLYFPPIYAWVLQVVCFHQVSPLKPCTQFYAPPSVLHALPILVFLAWTPELYLMRNTEHKAPS